MVAALGAILSANVLAQTSCQSSTYTVVSGDTCNGISSELNVTVAALLAANPVVNAQCTNLFIGEVLCVPTTAPPTPPTPPTTSNCTANYTVASGDVCISIANQFNITASQLEAVNTEINANCTNLVPGEVLCIP
ncbi:hypothetical protein BT96DRAFT_913903, partial [Gymnopus androsaceus JB14]